MPTAVLVSGAGTILGAIVDSGVPVDLVVADRPCPALGVAESLGVRAVVVDRAGHGGFSGGFDREGYTKALAELLEVHGIDLVCMAGFGTVLAPAFFARFGGRTLNTHPSLLPAFPGWHPVRDALAAGATTTGCTVHLATEALDAGPVLRQAVVEVAPGDDEPALHERIKEVERALYPSTIALVRAALDRGEPATSVARR